MKPKITLLAALCILLCSQLFASVIYVDSSHVGGIQSGSGWQNSISNFQTAVNLANAGDTLWVAQGTYQPDSNASFSMKEGVKILGGFPNTAVAFQDRNLVAYPTILKGNHNVVIRNDNNGLTTSALLDGFTVTNGYNLTDGGGMYNSYASPSIYNCIFTQNTSCVGYTFSGGGGIYNIHSSPVIINCIFSQNAALHSSSGGGGILNLTYSSPVIQNCSFLNNSTGSNGGGVSNVVYSSPTVTNCIFSNNNGPNGGGLYNENSSAPVITNCSFTGNVAANGGGGIKNILLAAPVITNCTFTGNTTPSQGGGMLNYDFANVTVVNCKFSGNEAANGGGVDNVSYIKAKFINCSFIGNKAIYRGGGFVYGASFNTIKVINCTFSRDTALVEFGAMYNSVDSTDTLVIVNSIIFNNSDTLINDANGHAPTVLYSNVQGGFPGTGNLNVNPQFINPNGGDYGLSSSSPVINMGINDSVPAGIATDLAGNARIVGGVVDMGCYEYGVVLPPNINLGNDTGFCSSSLFILDAKNPGCTYLWNTGATTSTISVVGSGTYFVSVTNSAGTSSDTIHITVNASPVLYLGNDTGICSGNSISLNAQNTGSSYLWNTGATTQTINVTATGNYWVRVTAPDQCKTTDTIHIVSNPAPVVNLGNDTGICSGTVLNLNAQNAGNTFLWNNGSTAQTLAVNTAGNYFVKVTTSALCVGSDTIHVSINPVPVVTLGNDTSICQGSLMQLNAQNPGSTYLWDDGTTTATKEVTATGFNAVTVTNSYNCKASDTIHVSVNPTPVLQLGNDTAFCANDAILLDAGNAGSTYAWNTGSNTQTINVDTSGTYNVIATNSFNCSAKDSIQVIVHPLPVKPFGNDTTICNGSTLILDALNNGSSYLWNTGSTAQAINVTTEGNYSVIITTPYNCTEGDDIYVTVIQTAHVDGFNFIPLFQENMGKVQFYPLAPVNTDSYEWDFGDNTAHSTNQNPIHTYAIDKAYNVNLKVFNSCGFFEQSQRIELDFTGIETVNGAKNDIRIFPNPGNGMSKISNGDKDNGMKEIEIIDQLGKRIYMANADNAMSHQLLLSALPSGLYSVRVHCLKGITVLKLEVVQ